MKDFSYDGLSDSDDIQAVKIGARKIENFRTDTISASILIKRDIIGSCELLQEPR
jgi:hypothetical protein